MSDAGGTRLTVDDDELHPRAPAQNPLAPYGYEPVGDGYYPPLRADQDHRYPWQTEDWRPYASGLPRLAERAGGSVYTKPSDVFGAAAEAAGKYGAHLAHGLWQAGPGTFQRVMTGELQPGTREFNEAAANTALAYGVLGLPIPRPYGSLGMFGGPQSRTAPRMQLSEARGMEYEARRRLKEEGVPYNKDDFRDPIFEHTGWAKDASGQWNYIIPDAGAELINLDHPLMRTTEYTSPFDPAKNKTWYAPHYNFGQHLGADLTVGDILKHDYLYKGYPDLKDIKIKPVGPFDRSMGAYSAKENTIYLGLNTKEDLLSVLMHELQHAVQHREGFARGGSMDEFLPHDFAGQMSVAQDRLNKLNTDIGDMGLNPYRVRQYYGIGEHAAPDRKYYSKGESEAMEKVSPYFLEAYKEAVNEHGRLSNMRVEAFDKYQNLMGEVQSRATQAMLHSRRWDRPAWEIGELSWDTQGQHKIVPYTPEHEQIYRPQRELPPPPYGGQPRAPTMPRSPTAPQAPTTLTPVEEPSNLMRSEPINLADERAKRVAAQEEEKRAGVRKGLEEMRSRLVDERPSYPMPKEVTDALKYFDSLGFETNREAISEIRRAGPNWQTQFDMRPQHEFMPQMDDLARHKDTLTHRRHIDVLNKYLSRPAGGWPEGTKF